MKNRRTLWIVLSLFTVFVLALSACGGTTATETTPTEAPAAEPTGGRSGSVSPVSTPTKWSMACPKATR